MKRSDVVIEFLNYLDLLKVQASHFKGKELSKANRSALSDLKSVLSDIYSEMAGLDYES